ncbi:MAG: 30S ribosomal protein S2 [Candidatus Paceibacterota bacterium]|jgi:small subunit ribosomal protein S2
MSNTSGTIDMMFGAGAHFGLGRSRRHPKISQYVFGTKNQTDIFDLEKTQELLEKAKTFMITLAKEGKTILFVGGKKEASDIVKMSSQSINMPYINGRWIGGTLTNFGNIRKRVERYETLLSEKEKGELAKYTKRERMLIDKEIEKLEKMFLGIVSMKKLPDAIIIVDPRREKTAMSESKLIKIPIIALSSSDCDISDIKYPLVGNDSAKTSISFFLSELIKVYQDNKIITKSI